MRGWCGVKLTTQDMIAGWCFARIHPLHDDSGSEATVGQSSRNGVKRKTAQIRIWTTSAASVKRPSRPSSGILEAYHCTQYPKEVAMPFTIRQIPPNDTLASQLTVDIFADTIPAASIARSLSLQAASNSATVG